MPEVRGAPPGRLRHFIMVAVPLVFILAGMVVGFIFYAQSRERYFTQRYLRALATLAEQMEGAIDGRESAVDQALNDWKKAAGVAAAQHDDLLNVPASEGADLDRLRSVRCRFEGRLKEQLDLIPMTLSGSVPGEVDRLQGSNAGVIGKPTMNRLQQSWPVERNSPTLTEQAPSETADASLYFCRAIPWEVRSVALEGNCAWPANASHFCAESSMRDVLTPLISQTALAPLDLFVVDHNGTTLYERGTSGLRLAALTTEAKVPPAGAAPGQGGDLPSLSEVSATTVVRPVTVDGTQYHLFTQPVRLRAGRQSYATWAIGVLVPIERMRADARRVPMLIMSGVPLLFLCALLALPLLGLFTMGPRDPLTAANANAVALSAIGAAMLITLLTLNWYGSGRLNEEADGELRRTSRLLRESFADELSSAAATLERFRAARAVQPEIGLPDRYVVCTDIFDGSQCHVAASDAAARARLQPDVGAVLAPADTYRGLEMLILSDRDGNQVEKWSVRKATTPFTPMGPFNSFRDPMRRRLLSPRSRLEPSRRTSLAINVMTSPNTAQTLTVLSMPLSQGRGTAMMVARLLSLEGPLLAPGLDMATIEPSGLVLFHSNERRRLYENFFAESGGEARLQSAVFARQAGFFDVDYHGLPKRAFVHPLADTPWSIVVLRDKDQIQTATLEVMSTCVLLLALLLAVYGVVYAVILCTMRGRRQRGSRQSRHPKRGGRWPDPRCVGRYRWLIGSLTALALWLASAIARYDSLGTLLVGTAAPLLGLVGVLAGLGLGRDHDPRGLRWAELPGAALKSHSGRTYVLLGVGLAAASVPCLVADSWGLVCLVAFAACHAQVLRAGLVQEATPVRGAYTAMALALLVVVAVLPAVAVYEDAFDLAAASISRVRQLKLLDALAAHRRAVGDYLRDVAGGDGLVEYRLRGRGAPWTFAGRRAFENGAAPAPAAPPVRSGGAVARLMKRHLADATRDDERARDEPCLVAETNEKLGDDLTARWLSALRRQLSSAVVQVLPVYNQSQLELRHALFDHASDCSWASDPAASGAARLAWRAPYGASFDPMVAWRHTLDLPPLGLRWIVLLLIAAALAAAAYVAARGLIARIFQLDVDVAGPPAPQAPSGWAGRFYLRPPPETVRELVREASVIDLEKQARPEGLAHALYQSLRARVVVLHLERCLDEPEWNRQKLALLEALVLQRGVEVDVVSDVDVLEYFARRLHSPADEACAATYLSAAEMERWAHVLAQLSKVRFDLPADEPQPNDPAMLERRRAAIADEIAAECRHTPQLLAVRDVVLAGDAWQTMSHRALIRYIGDLANAHYRDLWNTLTDEERLVLYHLANEGFVNPRNGEVARRLMRRGLIRRDPALVPMNESFERFVKQVEDAATIRHWERAGGASAWEWLRTGFVVIVVLGAFFLFITQPDAYSRWGALIAALATVGTQATQLLGLFQGPRAKVS